MVDKHVKGKTQQKRILETMCWSCQSDAGAEGEIDRELQNFPSACEWSVTPCHSAKSISDMPKPPPQACERNVGETAGIAVADETHSAKSDEQCHASYTMDFGTCTVSHNDYSCLKNMMVSLAVM